MQNRTDARKGIGGPGKERSLEDPKARSLQEIRCALEGCYSSMLALCSDLSDAEWQVQSLCPDWKVRDVVNHVTSIEAVMAGWLTPRSITFSLPNRNMPPCECRSTMAGAGPLRFFGIST